jgi:hypothetical protein
MPDIPPKRTSLAEMARVAAQKSLRPPPTDGAAPAFQTPPPSSVRGLAPAPPAMFPSSPPAAPPGSVRTGDSGMIHLHELSSSPAIEPEPAAVPAPASSTSGVLVEHAHVKRAASSRPAPAKRRGTSWLLVGGIVVLAGAATAGVAAKKGLSARDAAQRIMAVFKPAPLAAPITPFQPNEENAAARVTAAQPAPAQTAPSTRPEPSANTAAHAATVSAGEKQPIAAAHVAPKADKPATPQTKPSEVQVPVVPEHRATAPANPLANAMEKAAGPQSVGGSVSAAAQPQVGSSDVPEIPPQGAILGAIGARRQAARTCVRGLDGPSRATLVFASTGKVQSVTVSGPATGGPAESCLKNVFTKVSVDPFRRATYTSSTTISP